MADLPFTNQKDPGKAKPTDAGSPALEIPSPSGKSKKIKIFLILLGLLFILASIPAAVYLTKQRQTIFSWAQDAQTEPGRAGAAAWDACKRAGGSDAICHGAASAAYVGREQELAEEGVTLSQEQKQHDAVADAVRTEALSTRNKNEGTETANISWQEAELLREAAIVVADQTQELEQEEALEIGKKIGKGLGEGVVDEMRDVESQLSVEIFTVGGQAPPPSAVRGQPVWGDKLSYCQTLGFTKVDCGRLPGDFATCESDPKSDGACCQTPGGLPACAWFDKTYSSGLRGGITRTKDSVIMPQEGSYQVNICYGEPGASCPISTNCEIKTMTGKEFKAPSCSQIDVMGTINDQQIGSGVCNPEGCGVSPEAPPEETPPPTATSPPPPGYSAMCERCRVYDENWDLIADPSTITVGQAVYFATLGSTTHPQGITKARFRINGTADTSWCSGSGSGFSVVNNWCETTSKSGNEFYISYTIPSAGSYTVESMVYNPGLGWF